MSDLIDAVSFFVKLASLPQYTKVHGPYDRRSGKNDVRQFVILIYPDGHRETITYPRYLAEQRLGRKLDKNETIDHIDRNPLNNDPSNIQILPRDQHSALDTRRVKLVDCVCVDCGKPFSRSPRLIRQRSGRGGPFCSRQCASRYTRKVQLGKARKAPTQKHTPSEYWRRDKTASHAEQMAVKWGFRKQGS